MGRSHCRNCGAVLSRPKSLCRACHHHNGAVRSERVEGRDSTPTHWLDRISLSAILWTSFILLICVLAFIGGFKDARDPGPHGFSSWDGSHIKLTRHVVSKLKDPDSFQHIETVFGDSPEHGFLVKMEYRAKNSFGGYVVDAVIAVCDKQTGELIAIVDVSETNEF